MYLVKRYFFLKENAAIFDLLTLQKIYHILYMNSVSLLYRNLNTSLTVFTLFIREVRVFVSNSSTYLLYHVKVLSLIGDFAHIHNFF